MARIFSAKRLARLCDDGEIEYEGRVRPRSRCCWICDAGLRGDAVADGEPYGYAVVSTVRGFLGAAKAVVEARFSVCDRCGRAVYRQRQFAPWADDEE